MAWSAGQAREMRRKYKLGEFARDASPHRSKLPKTSSFGKSKTRRIRGRSGGHKTGALYARMAITRGDKMARKGRRFGRRSKGGMGGLIGMNNLIGTLGGAYIAPSVGISPQIGAAAGSYFFGKQGIKGAVIGYVAAPMLLNFVGGITGKSTTPSSGSGTVFY